MAPRVAIIIYTMYHHIAKMAEAELAGIKKAGGDAKIFQVAETLPADVLTKMHAPPKPDYPIATPQTLLEYDAFLFGVPTRFGNSPSQWRAFWDQSGQLWATGGLFGKYVGQFVGTAGPGGGQEETFITALTTYVHHGMIFVPLGYAKSFGQLANVDEVHGGSPYGAGTLSKSDGSRQPSPLELEIATIQGQSFYETVSKVLF